MERPSSAANTTTTKHKRNASSKSHILPSGPSTTALFVINLRLLNFDLLADWPNITASSFTNHDARTKIKCTEYALYQLFQVYDPVNTADKLQPFFPPLEPLQSIHLRAALFRCLNELRKNGVLPKETILRKTMLDECQGDKFWELCLSFSALVLRKVTQEKGSASIKPIASRLGNAQAMSKSQRESMLPLAIAHKAALSRVLEEKRRKKETYTALYEIMIGKQVELRQRQVRSEAGARQRKNDDTFDLSGVDKAVNKSWVGSAELKDALINGDICGKGDSMFQQPFERLWSNGSVSTHEQDLVKDDDGLLQALSERAAEQSARLKKWQDFHDRLLASRPTKSHSSRPSTSASQKLKPRFDRHRDMCPSKSTASDEMSSLQAQTARTTTTRYDDILTAMREDLRKTSAHRIPPTPTIRVPKRASTQPSPAPRLTINIARDVSPSNQNPQHRSASQTAVPVRPRMGRRISSQSKAYQPRKVESQLEPIPLMAELFSPVKAIQGVTLSSSVLEVPPLIEEVEPARRKIDSVIDDGEKDVLQKSVTGDSTVETTTSDVDDLKGSVIPTCAVEPKAESKGPIVHEFKVPEVPQKPRQTTTDATARPSLAERTRMSIAYNSSDDISLNSVPASPISPVRPETKRPEQPTLPTTSLLDRTRHSISLAPPPSTKVRKPDHHRSHSSVAYSANDFDTPQNRKRSSTAERKTSAIDVEVLMSPEVEYESVFKSRPRIAVSPVLSPVEFDNGQSLASLERSGIDV